MWLSWTWLGVGAPAGARPPVLNWLSGPGSGVLDGGAMLYRLAAEAVLLFHLGFILFVVLGAVAVARRPWLMALHLPVAAWGFLIEATGRDCPLTYVENALREGAGQAGYAGGFVEHYLVGIIYPAGLSHDLQWALAAAVLLINGAIYALLARRRWRAG
jgi:hypothetical protein